MNNNSYREVNFLPAWYFSAQRRRQTIRRKIVLLGVMIFIMCLMGAITNQRRLGYQKYYNSLNDQLAATKVQTENIVALNATHEQLVKQDEIYNRHIRPVNYSQITGTLAGLMPQEISLDNMSIKDSTSQKIITIADKAVGEKVEKTENVTYPIVKIEISGSAPSQKVIADMVEKIADSKLFINVKTVNSSQGSLGDIPIRQFSISMDVPLDCTYRQVDQQEVAHAD